MALAGESRSEDRREFSVELLLYAFSFGLAVVLRLFALDRWPLLDGEAGLALAAWRLARGLPATLRGHSPLLLHVNALLFFLSNGSDVLARSLSVLFGSLIALWPYGLRRQLGRMGAVAASLLLALSPSLTYFSRTADGSIVVAFCALGLVVLAADYMHQRRAADVLAGAALLVLALLSAPLVYTLLAVLVTFPVFLRVWPRSTQNGAPWGRVQLAWADLVADSHSRRKGLLLSAVLFLGLGTAFALNPAGLQMTVDQLGQWLGGLEFLKGTWYRSLQLLLLYETLPLLLGAAGLLAGRDRRDTFTLLLRYWVVVAFVLSILPGYRPAHSVLLVLLPLVLGAGLAAEDLRPVLQEGIRQPWFWVLVALSLLIFAAAYVQLATYLTMPVSTYVLRTFALCVFLVSAHAMLWSWMGPRIPLCAATLSLLLLLSLILVRTEVRLNYLRARDPTEPMVGATTSPDVLDLARYATRLSSQLYGDPRVMDWEVDSSLEIPFGWYLRSFERVSYVSSAAVAPQAAAVILPATAPAPARYVGLRFRLHTVGAGGMQPLLEWARWWTGNRSAFPVQAASEVMLWVTSAQQE